MSIQNPYDHALKILARTYPEEFLRLGFPEQSVHLLGTLVNVELALEIDRVDFYTRSNCRERKPICTLIFN